MCMLMEDGPSNQHVAQMILMSLSYGYRENLQESIGDLVYVTNQHQARTRTSCTTEIAQCRYGYSVS